MIQAPQTSHNWYLRPKRQCLWRDGTIDIKRKYRLLKVCYVSATSATFLAFFSFFLVVAINSINEANKGGSTRR
jgi:hypothetical protein